MKFLSAIYHLYVNQSKREASVDLTIDSTEDENENWKSKIAEIEGRDSRTY